MVVVMHYFASWLCLLKVKECRTFFYMVFNVCINTYPVNRFMHNSLVFSMPM